MKRDYGEEIDGLKEELAQMKMILQNAYSIVKKESKDENSKEEKIHEMKNMHPDSRLSELMDSLTDLTEKNNSSGAISYLGIFASGGRQSNWISHEVSTDQLLALIENKVAEKVIACIGNQDRLNILMALLKKPMTVAQLVEQCGFNTTGQVYHHLKPLLAADLLREDEQNRGGYHVVPYRVQGIIMLLAGISDMVDTKYTQGNWE